MATYTNLTDFLIKHQANNFKDKVVTHTRIGSKDKTKKIYGGSYVIEPDELDIFHKLYYQHVFVNKNMEYLTEVQLKDDGPIAVDLDFRYDINITKRQHNDEDIQDIVLMYLDILKEGFVFNGDSNFDIFIFQKQNVNIVKEKNITKDGIHMLINIKTDHITQQIIRNKALEEISVRVGVLNLPLTNSWEEVFDEGISKGCTNWQLFGSRKPENEAYKLSHHYNIEVDEIDGEFMMNQQNIQDFNFKDNFKLLTVQNDSIPEFPMTQLFEKKYDNLKKEFQQPYRNQKKKRLVLDEGETDTESVCSINEDKELIKEGKCRKRLEILRSCFEAGQYNNWYKIGCILKSILPYELGLKLFTQYSYIEPFNTEKEKENTTQVFEKIKPNSKYTLKSLDLMCQQINPAEYEKNCATVISGGDNEAAILIYKELKDVFVYSAGKFWYKFNNKWYNNEKEVKMIVKNYILNRGLVTAHENEKTGKTTYRLYSSCNNHAKNILDVLCGKCVENKDDKFSDKFIETTKNKICFNNGVLNLATKEFKNWEQSQDVFTTIIIDYDYNPNRKENDINDVLNKIFISIFGDDYKRALHFFSRAITGNIQDKSWGMFIGSRNCGKGVNECLFKNTFMDYIGSISSDLFIYKGKNSGDDLKLWGWIQDIEAKRLCFIQESKLDDGDNHLKLDGVMIKKVSSGGDPIQNRKNFQDPINSYIQTTFMFNANDIPPFTKGSGDCMETCSTFSSAKQFKSKEFIDERIANNACETELSLYYERDDFIKDKCKSMEWKQALIHIILDNFNESAVKSVNKFKEEDDCDDVISVILKSFKITKNKNDKITNKDLKIWGSNNGVHLSKKLKPILKQFGCEEYKDKERGLRGLILLENDDGVEEE